jgi:cardiolipin synthase
VVPDQSLRDALINAALRGVEVILLTQRSPPDHWLPYWSSRYYWEELMDAGVRIFTFQAGMMHAKMIVADSAWVSIGSANFDIRSLSLNFEVSGISDDKQLVKRAEESLESHLARSREISLADFQGRDRIERAYEGFAHLFAPLL